MRKFAWNYVCPICKKPFTSNSNMTIYCPNCRKEGYKRKRRIRRYNKCPRCGASKFETSKQCQKCNGETHRGANSHKWKGGKSFDKRGGYIKVYMGDSKYKNEHTLVWEKAHKRKLPKNWVIHHINGVKTDNRIKNLTAMPRNKHTNWTLLHIAQKRIRALEQPNLPFK